MLNLLDLVYLKYFKLREVKPDINQRKEKLENLKKPQYSFD